MSASRWYPRRTPELIPGVPDHHYKAPQRKEAEARKLRRHIDAFLAAGGRITVLTRPTQH